MEDRLAILEAIERGEISVQEGLRRLESGNEAAVVGDEPARDRRPAVSPLLVRVVWQAVFWAGVALETAGGVLVAGAHAWSIWPGWEIVGWVLFALGVAIMAIGWWMRTARWLAIRIREQSGPRLTLAFPVPLGLAYWALRLSRSFVPRLHDVPAEELVTGLEEALREGGPVSIDVHDEEDGNHVQVHFA